MSSRAVLCKAFGPATSLVFEAVPAQPLADNEVRVAVHACGVNFPDNLIVAGLYQFKPDFPFSPGSEAAGEVVEVGAAVTRFTEGDRVVWFGLHGAFREELVVDATELVAIPAQMPMRDAAAFLMTYGTSMHALKDRAALQSSETLLVLGAGGGVGLAALELGRQMGARVIAAASTDAKLEAAREHGADEVINYEQQDLRQRIRDLTDNKGVDVLYDPVGGDLAQVGLRSMAINGRYLVVGFASGDIPSFAANLALLKECQITGVFYGAFIKRQPDDAARNIDQLFAWHGEGVLRPRIHGVWPLHQVAQALSEFDSRRVVGKIVLEVERED